MIIMQIGSVTYQNPRATASVRRPHTRWPSILRVVRRIEAPWFGIGGGNELCLRWGMSRYMHVESMENVLKVTSAIAWDKISLLQVRLSWLRGINGWGVPKNVKFACHLLKSGIRDSYMQGKIEPYTVWHTEVSSEFEPVKLLDQNAVKLDLEKSYVEKAAHQILVPWLGYAAMQLYHSATWLCEGRTWRSWGGHVGHRSGRFTRPMTVGCCCRLCSWGTMMIMMRRGNVGTMMVGRGEVCKSHAKALGILIRVDHVAAGKILETTKLLCSLFILCIWRV